MPDPITIHDLDDPRLDPYRNQRDAWLRAPHNPAATVSSSSRASPDSAALRESPPAHGESPAREGGHPLPSLFMAEGVLVVRTLLVSSHRVHSILATPARFDLIRHDVARHAPDAPIYLAPPALLERIVGFDLHRGLLAAGHRPPPRLAADLMRSRVLVLAEDLSNHDNIGALFRTVAALVGPDASVLLSPRCCDPLYRKSLRVSMGHALTVPYATLAPWPGALASVATAGYRIVALTTPPDPASVTPPPGQLPPFNPTASASAPAADTPIALLLGAEGPGLAPETLAILSTLHPRPARLSIPMAPGVDSLNVVVALAIALDRLNRSNLLPNPHETPPATQFP